MYLQNHQESQREKRPNRCFTYFWRLESRSVTVARRNTINLASDAIARPAIKLYWYRSDEFVVLAILGLVKSGAEENGVIMSSVREIARKTGLSAATVSRALQSRPGVSDATRDIVASEAKRSGYSPSAPLRQGTSVGYVVPGNTNLWEYDWMLLGGVMEGLRQSELDLTLLDIQGGKARDESYAQFFARSGIRGVVVRSTRQQQASCDEILAGDYPSVLLAERADDRPDINFVCCDSSRETGNAVHHLVDLGHRRIAIVMHRRADSDHLDRRRGYLEACEALAIEESNRIVIQVSANLSGGRTALNRLMSQSLPPTAIIFTDPKTATGAMLRAQEVGLKIPADLSIVGFDDGMQRHAVHPTMTVVYQDTHEIGLEAGIWLGRKIKGLECPPLRKVLHATLEINQTTGVPPQDVLRLAPNGDVIS